MEAKHYFYTRTYCSSIFFVFFSVSVRFGTVVFCFVFFYRRHVLLSCLVSFGLVLIFFFPSVFLVFVFSCLLVFLFSCFLSSRFYLFWVRLFCFVLCLCCFVSFFFFFQAEDARQIKIASPILNGKELEAIQSLPGFKTTTVSTVYPLEKGPGGLQVSRWHGEGMGGG